MATPEGASQGAGHFIDTGCLADFVGRCIGDGGVGGRGRVDAEAKSEEAEAYEDDDGIGEVREEGQAHHGDACCGDGGAPLHRFSGTDSLEDLFSDADHGKDGDEVAEGEHAGLEGGETAAYLRIGIGDDQCACDGIQKEVRRGTPA